MIIKCNDVYYNTDHYPILIISATELGATIDLHVDRGKAEIEIPVLVPCDNFFKRLTKLRKVVHQAIVDCDHFLDLDKVLK